MHGKTLSAPKIDFFLGLSILLQTFLLNLSFPGLPLSFEVFIEAGLSYLTRDCRGGIMVARIDRKVTREVVTWQMAGYKPYR